MNNTNVLLFIVRSARRRAAALNSARLKDDLAAVQHELRCTRKQAARWLSDQGNAQTYAVKLRRVGAAVEVYTLWVEHGTTQWAQTKTLGNAQPLPLPR